MNSFFSAEDLKKIDEMWEKVIVKHKPVEMPNGTKGFICLICKNFCAYVEPNCKDGYKCPDCR